MTVASKRVNLERNGDALAPHDRLALRHRDAILDRRFFLVNGDMEFDSRVPV